MPQPPRRWDPFRPLDLLTSVWSVAAVLPVSTGATAAYRTAFSTLRPLVVGRRITVQRPGGSVALTITEFDSRWDPLALPVGQLGTLTLAARNLDWAGTAVNTAVATLNNVHIRPSVPPVLVTSPIDVLLEVPSATLDTLLRSAAPRFTAEIDDDGVARIGLVHVPGGRVEVDAQVSGSILLLKPRGFQLGRARLGIPGLLPAYRLQLPELPHGITVTAVTFGPGVLRVSACLPEWQLDVPRAALDELINQLSVVGRPLNVIWPT